MQRLITAVLCAGLAIFNTPPVDAAPRIPVYVIGDSLNDTGTFAPVTATGRFTTTPGLIWTEIVAARHNATVAPAYFFDGTDMVANPGGTNFAQSGALVTAANGLFDGASKPIRWQVDRLIERYGDSLSGGLVLMDGGGPDIILQALQVQGGHQTVADALANAAIAARQLAGEAKRLSEAGPKTLVLLGVADFGATPMFGAGGTDASALMTALSRTFNATLDAEAARIGLDAVRPDVFAFFDDIVTTPAKHGLTNVTAPGVDPERAPATPTGNSANSNIYHLVESDAASRYLFADGLHPSAKGHRLLADFVLNALVAR